MQKAVIQHNPKIRSEQKNEEESNQPANSVKTRIPKNTAEIVDEVMVYAKLLAYSEVVAKIMMCKLGRENMFLDSHMTNGKHYPWNRS